jgi:hypothetical protein
LFSAVILAAVCLCLPAGQLAWVKAEKNPKPEEVAERAILAYGSRAALYGIQRNGTLRALVKFFAPEEVREGKSVTKFIRKQKLAEDLLMIELELPGTKYTIGFDGQETWAIQDGEIQKPSSDAVKAFRSAHEHSYEALLRYKENNAKLEYVSTNKLGTFEVDVIDLISPAGSRTRYEISRKSGRILYVNYEEKPGAEAAPVKYRLNFKDFRVIQNTLVPYETLVFQDGKLVEERKVVESVFNIQLDEKAFKAENANKLAESPIKP